MDIKLQLKNLLENVDTKEGKFFALFIQSLIILSLVTFSIETLPRLPEKTEEFLAILEIFIVILFTVEYLLRIYVSQKKVAFVFSFFGIVDLLAILPFYLSTRGRGVYPSTSSLTFQVDLPFLYASN